MFILWALSTMVESVVLYIISKKPFGRAMLASSAINVYRYDPLYLWINMNILSEFSRGFRWKALNFFRELVPPIRPGEIPRKKPTAV